MTIRKDKRLTEFYKARQEVADVFSKLQATKERLIRMGCEEGVKGTPEGTAMVILGQLMEKGKDAMQEDFIRVVGEVG